MSSSDQFAPREPRAPLRGQTATPSLPRCRARADDDRDLIQQGAAPNLAAAPYFLIPGFIMLNFRSLNDARLMRGKRCARLPAAQPEVLKACPGHGLRFKQIPRIDKHGPAHGPAKAEKIET